MKTQIGERLVSLWLSSNDTYDWAHKPGASWPCSQLSGNRIFVQWDTNGLCDFTMNGREADVDSTELNACCADHLSKKLPKDHPCYDVAVGQFLAA